MCDKKPFGRLAETSAVRHSPEGVPVDAVADVMGRLISQGLIRGWGLSQVSAETKFEGDDVRRWVPQLSKENILANQPILDVLSDCARKKRSHKRAAFSRVDAPRKVSHKTGGAKRSKANHKKQARP